MRSKLGMFLLTTLVVAASSIAAADPSDSQVNVKSEVVRFDDLRIISTVGAAVLYGRLRGAAVSHRLAIRPAASRRCNAG